MLKAAKLTVEELKQVWSHHLSSKVAKFQDDLDTLLNILVKDWQTVLKKSGIKDSQEDIQHIQNQLDKVQIGSIGSVDTAQLKRDKRKNDEMARMEKAIASLSESNSEIYEPEDAAEVEAQVDVNQNEDNVYMPDVLEPTSKKRNQKIDVE